MYSGSEGPVTVPEDGNHPTVPGVGVNVHGVTANHEVLVDHGVIDAVAAELILLPSILPMTRILFPW